VKTQEQGHVLLLKNKFNFIFFILFIPLLNTAYGKIRQNTDSSLNTGGKERAAFKHNPAAIILVPRAAFKFTFAMPYTFPDLYSFMGKAVISMPGVSTGICYKYLSRRRLYSENFLRAEMAFPFRNKTCSLGMGVSYYNQKVDGEKQSFNPFNLHIGTFFKIRQNILLSAACNNLLSAPAETELNNILPEINTGLGLTLFKHFLFFFRLSYTVKHGVAFELSQEYNFRDFLFCKTEITTAPAALSLDLGLKLKNIFLNYTLKYHPELKFTHITAVSFNLQRYRQRPEPVSADRQILLNINKAGPEKLYALFGDSQAVSNILAAVKQKKIIRKKELLAIVPLTEKELYYYAPSVYIDASDFKKTFYLINHITAGQMKQTGISKKAIKDYLFARDQHIFFSSLKQALEVFENSIDAQKFKKIIAEWK